MLKSSCDKNTESQIPERESDNSTNHSEGDRTSDYYDDDSTGYEIYKDEEDEADDSSRS